MISKCANPACCHPFHFLRPGRLFQFDVRLPLEPCRDVPITVCSRKPHHATIYFWLCGECAPMLTVRFEPHMGVSVVSRQQVSTATTASVAGMQ